MKYRAHIAGPGWSKTWVIEAATDKQATDELAAEIRRILSVPQPAEAREREELAMVSLKDKDSRLVLRRSIVDMVVHQ